MTHARFADVDASRRDRSHAELTDALRERLATFPIAENVDAETLQADITANITALLGGSFRRYEDFADYYEHLRRCFQEQAELSDVKASMLLDKGALYTRVGVLFYIAAISIFQTLSILFSYQPQFLYGMASCSLLFVFIMFLSAWHLRQYRQFVDTSTYMIKIKSIFDRYMLAYLVLRENGEASQDSLSQRMFELLSADIKWPDSYLLKAGDIGFAREAMEAMTSMAQSMRQEAAAVFGSRG